jgi:transposase
MTEKPTQPVPPNGVGGVVFYERLKRNEIKVLRRAGFSIRQVAEKADVGVNAVLRILAESGSPDPNTGRPR